jgi:Ni,Fe-hydrogenase III component G
MSLWRTFAWPWLGFSDPSNAAPEWQSRSTQREKADVGGLSTRGACSKRRLVNAQHYAALSQHYPFVYQKGTHLQIKTMQLTTRTSN